MASLLNSSLSSLHPQPTRESSFLKKSLIHPNHFPISINPKHKTPFTKTVKVRSDVSYEQRNSSSLSTSTTSTDDKIREILRNRDYDKKFGFNIDIDSFSIPKGLSKETIRLISTLKSEPDWMLNF
jgi:hypothetical protein